jgi:phage-related tail protein
MPILLKTIWTYIKTYWSYIVLAIIAIIGILTMRQGMLQTFVEQFKKINDAHDEEMKLVEDAREKEEQKHKENLEQLQKTLATIQQQYDIAKKELDIKKQQEIEDIIVKYSDDPKGLAERLSKSTGFDIILPE